MPSLFYCNNGGSCSLICVSFRPKVMILTITSPICPARLVVCVLLVTQVCDVVDCCKCLCSALCVAIKACYGPCANASSSSDPVYGTPALDAIMEGTQMMLSIEDLQNR